MKIYLITFFNSSGEIRRCIVRAPSRQEAIRLAVMSWDVKGIESIEVSDTCESLEVYSELLCALDEKKKLHCALHNLGSQ